MLWSSTTCLLEEPRPFAQSRLWELQRQYFAERGVDAWRQGEVPEYVTSNPTIAHHYAQVIVACWQDYLRLVPGTSHISDPFYLCELGAGSGRFAFHLLTHLCLLCERAHLHPLPFRYVLTDSSSALLAFWRAHPQFQRFFESGLLDLAYFDLEHSEDLHLHLSGDRLGAGRLGAPLIVIANYVFDSIVQDLYYLDEHRCSDCLAWLSVSKDLLQHSAAEVLAHLSISYTYELRSGPAYAEHVFNELLEQYQRELHATHLLFPATGLRCLQRLRRLSHQGILVLSADKGEHQLAALDKQLAPDPVRHGSFSLMVNYHAFHAFCQRSGGLALFPSHAHSHITTPCFLLLKQAQDYWQTQATYRQSIAICGPDDFYTISVHARKHVHEMTLEEILAYTRLSFFDSHLFAYYLPRLRELAPTLTGEEQQALVEAVTLVLAGSFSLSQSPDMASDLCQLLEFLGSAPPPSALNRA